MKPKRSISENLNQLVQGQRLATGFVYFQISCVKKLKQNDTATKM